MKKGWVEIGTEWTGIFVIRRTRGWSFRERETRRTLHIRFGAADDGRLKRHKKDVSA